MFDPIFDPLGFPEPAVLEAGAEGLMQKRHELQQQQQKLDAEAETASEASRVIPSPVDCRGSIWFNYFHGSS